MTTRASTTHDEIQEGRPNAGSTSNDGEPNFANCHPDTFFWISLLAALLIRRLIYSTARVLMVRKHGWPPAHLDADGDPISDVFKED